VRSEVLTVVLIKIKSLLIWCHVSWQRLTGIFVPFPRTLILYSSFEILLSL